MSFLDCFASAADIASDNESHSPVALSDRPSVAQRHPLLDTFAQSADLADSDECDSPVDGSQLGASSERAEAMHAPGDASVQQQLVAGRRRGRPHGSTSLNTDRRKRAAEVRSEAAASMTKSQKCSIKQKEAWARKRAANETALRQALQASSQVALREAPAQQQLVPLVSPSSLAVPLSNNAVAQTAFMSETLPAAEPSQVKALTQMISKFCQSITKRSIAKELKIKTKALSRKVRIVAAAMVLFCRNMHLALLKKFHEKLLDTYGADNVVALSFTVKQKYDEMSLRLKVTERRGTTQPSVVAKLFQVCVWWQAVFMVNGSPLAWQCKLPTTLRCIEKTSARCQRSALIYEAEFPGWAKVTFRFKTRLSIADSHKANDLADEAIWADEPECVLLKFKCTVHLQHKVAKFVSTPFDMDVRGMLHSTLAFSFASKWSEFKSNLKQLIRRRLVIRPFGQRGAGDAAYRYRESVYKQYLSNDDSRQCGAKAARRASFLHVVRRLLNGRYRRTECVEHCCSGAATCCASAEETLELLETQFVDKLEAPKVWCESRWLGIDQSSSVHGFLLSCHNLFEPAFRMTFYPEAAANDDTQERSPQEMVTTDDAEDVEDGEVDCQPDGDGVLLAEPLKEATPEQRQKTYRDNAKRWVDSKPTGRLYALTSVMRCQQDSAILKGSPCGEDSAQ